MSDTSEDTRKALQLMLDYLKEHYSYQLTSLQNVDSKVNIRLTIYAGLLGLVTLGLPALASRAVPSALLAVAVLLIGAFMVCLFGTLWLAMSVLEVKVDLPGVKPAEFKKAAVRESVASLQVLRELVVNYARAVENTWVVVEKRVAPGEALKKWSRATMVTAFVTVGFFGMVYIVAPPERNTPAGKECEMANQDEKPQASASTQGQSGGADAAPSGGAEAQPSLLAEPMRIELGRSAGGGSKQAIVTVVPKPESADKKE